MDVVGTRARGPVDGWPATVECTVAGVQPSAPAGVEVRRSARRRRTVSAHRENGVTVVLIPARMSRADERHWVDVMVRRLDGQDRSRRPSDAVLLERAEELSRAHLDGRATPTSVRWVSNQGARWGSCTPADGSIRLSDRLRGMPRWVIDYVLFHELVHLLVVGHTPEFWELVGRIPRADRARGYLEGYTAGALLTDQPGTQEHGADDSH